MKTFFIMICILLTLFINGCSSCDDTRKDSQIDRLRAELARQKGARNADLEFAERQVSVYLGCIQFFNLCSPEINALGPKLLQNGFTGTTSVWYWLGFMGRPISIAVAVGAFLAVLFSVSSFLHLKLIEPKKELVKQMQRLIDTANERVSAANLRANELEKTNGILRRERHQLIHPPKVKTYPVAIPTVSTEINKIKHDLPVRQLPKKPDDF